MRQVQESLNSRYGNMYKAFQFVDTDRSGTLSMSELRRALDMWNVQFDPTTLEQLVRQCDSDGNGGIDYKEFVDALARDTVAPSAMGKRDMQSKEAMGVGMFDELDRLHGRATREAGRDERELSTLGGLYKRIDF